MWCTAWRQGLEHCLRFRTGGGHSLARKEHSLPFKGRHASASRSLLTLPGDQSCCRGLSLFCAFTWVSFASPWTSDGALHGHLLQTCWLSLSTAARVRSLLCSPPAPAAEVGRDGRGEKPKCVATEGQPQLVCAGRAGPRWALVVCFVGHLPSEMRVSHIFFYTWNYFEMMRTFWLLF